MKFVTYNAQVPLRRNAIQIKVGASVDVREEVKAALDETLAGLKGDTNWTTPAIPASLAESDNYRYVLLAVAAAIVVGGLITLWAISKLLPRGGLLGIAFVIWLVGSVVARSHVRELMLVGSSLQMLGFGAGIAGLIDLFRRRKPMPTSVPRRSSSEQTDVPIELVDEE